MGERKLEIHRAVPSESFRYYDGFTQDIRDELRRYPRWKTQEFQFPNGALFFKFLRPEGVEADVRPHFIVPAWISGTEMAKSLLSLNLAVNAITRENEGTGLSLGQSVTVLAPYLEMRMDKASEDDGEVVEGEAASAEIIADCLEGVDRLVTANIHSKEAFDAIEKRGVEVINVSLVPLFAEIAEEIGIIDENTQVVATDIGILQTCLEFARYCGLDIKKQVTVIDKGARDQDRKISGLQVIYGEDSLNENSKVIMIDDIHDTGGSVDKVEKFIVEKGVKEIYQFFTHGVFSYPADIKVVERLKRGVVKGIWKSDSLPESKYRLNADSKIHAIEIAGLLSRVAVASINRPVEKLKDFPGLSGYIMEPKNKHEVWEDFCREVEYTSNTSVLE